MAKWTAAKRKKYLEEHPENFAGPDGSYPIEDASDVGDAWGLAGHAADPDAVRAKIKSIAKRLGLESGLPDTAKEDNKERSMDPIGADNDGNHEPMTGKHSHVHPAFGSQGDDDSHEHDHSHDGDADHQHDHGKRTEMPSQALLYMPITRIDNERREVEGVATSEAIDSFKTIFSYKASKRAFQDWIERTANCREMHERKAVGKGIGVFFDDENKKIIVRSRVSRSADGENTWIKFQEGILNGYSVGATNPVWSTVDRDGKIYPYLVSYKLGELSYVDNASNPDAQGLTICRADGLTELVDTTEDTSPAQVPAVSSSAVVRAGARVSDSTRAAMHDSIKHTLHAASSQMQNCGCDTCQNAMSHLDPDGDGDIDIGGYDDPDNDAESLYNGKNNADMDRAVIAALERVLPVVVERMFAPVYQRQQQLLARLAQTPEETPSFNTSELEERLTSAIVERVASASSLSELRADLSAVKEAVERIENQPAVGLAPILNGSRPVDKSFPLDRVAQGANAAPAPPGVMQRALSAMQGAGMLDTQDMQTKAATLLLQMQQPR
jgi:hypothetical protein